jgi:hypothetical protein
MAEGIGGGGKMLPSWSRVHRRGQSGWRSMGWGRGGRRGAGAGYPSQLSDNEQGCGLGLRRGGEAGGGGKRGERSSYICKRRWNEGGAVAVTMGDKMVVAATVWMSSAWSGR